MKDTLFKIIVFAGLAGLVAVWCLSNFYVGRLELALPRPVPDLSVTVSSVDGHSAVYTNPSITLMPGSYHLAVEGTGLRSSELETTVEFGKTTQVSIETGNEPAKRN